MILFRLRTTNRLHPDYLEIACSGVFSRAESQRVGQEAYRDAALAQRDTILIDVRQVTGRVPTILDRFEIGIRMAKHYRESDPRIRLAVLGHEPMIHPERFGELVARNRGADARVFTVEAEALEWIRSRARGP
ncbi:MAG TPA: STAS/SEC14 domain-containing protein [Vicinamibacterales bacterium]|nr:STAS/SEC14 domain-containing protein [Vicinamibacterales bacterium]